MQPTRTAADFVCLLLGLAVVYVRADGDPSCPCLTSAQLPALPFPGYGIGCATHELRLLASGAQQNLPFKAASCTAVPQPKWCQSSWCYVNVENCAVLVDYDNTPERLAFSYTTCGYSDLHESWWAASMSLRNETLRVVELSNQGGYLGSYCTNSGCTGPAYTFWTKVLANAGVKVQTISRFNTRDYPNASIPMPSPVMRQFKADYPKLQGNNTHFGCFYMTGMGYADLCINIVGVSTDRMAISNMIGMHQAKVWLVARESTPGGLGKMIGSAFTPFDAGAWLLVGIVLLAVGLLFFLQESLSRWQAGPPRTREDAKEVASTYLHISFESFMALCTGGRPGYEFQNLGSRLTGAGLAAFTLLVIAAYTSNLVTGLVEARRAQTEVSSLQDVLSKGYKMCAIANMKLSLVSLLKVPEAQVVEVQNYELLKRVKEGVLCKVGIHKDEDWIADRSIAGGVACEFKALEMVFTFTQGASVSARAMRGLGSQAQALVDAGGWEEAVKKSSPPDLCGASSSGSDGSLSAMQLAGPVLLAIIMAAVGLLVNLFQLISGCVLRRRDAKAVALKAAAAVRPPPEADAWAPGAEPVPDEGRRAGGVPDGLATP